MTPINLIYGARVSIDQI